MPIFGKTQLSFRDEHQFSDSNYFVGRSIRSQFILYDRIPTKIWRNSFIGRYLILCPNRSTPPPSPNEFCGAGELFPYALSPYGITIESFRITWWQPSFRNQELVTYIGLLFCIVLSSPPPPPTRSSWLQLCHQLAAKSKSNTRKHYIIVNMQFTRTIGTVQLQDLNTTTSYLSFPGNAGTILNVRLLSLERLYKWYGYFFHGTKIVPFVVYIIA